MFNEKQKEGFARVLDTLAASAIIGLFIAIFSRTQPVLELKTQVLLGLAAMLALSIACFLRE